MRTFYKLGFLALLSLSLSGQVLASGSKEKVQEESMEGMQVAIGEIFRQEIYQNLSFNGFNIAEDMLPSIDLNIWEASFFGTVTRYLSENPALGGDFNRGFNPKIWKNMVKVMFERVVPMTPDGYLLLPANKAMRVATTGLNIDSVSEQLKAGGNAEVVRLFLTNKNGELIGPDMLPINQGGLETMEGDLMDVGSSKADMASYANVQNLLNTNGMFFNHNPNYSTKVTVDGEDDWGLMDCFRLVADGRGDDAELCFKKLGENTLAQTVKTTKDMFVSGLRGAAGGALVGSLIPGMGTAAGAAYGALTNVLMVGYNTFLKKEKISPNQMRRLMFFVSSYTFAPTVYGELLPKTGRWVVTNKGMIRRALVMTDNDGNKRHIALDVAGNPIKKNQTVRINAGEGGAFKTPQVVPENAQPAASGPMLVPMNFRD